MRKRSPRVLPNDHLTFLRYRDLIDRKICNCRPTLTRWVKAGKFPKPIQLGTNSVAWRLHDVERWLEKKLGGAK